MPPSRNPVASTQPKSTTSRPGAPLARSTIQDDRSAPSTSTRPINTRSAAHNSSFLDTTVTRLNTTMPSHPTPSLRPNTTTTHSAYSSSGINSTSKLQTSQFPPSTASKSTTHAVKLPKASTTTDSTNSQSAPFQPTNSTPFLGFQTLEKMQKHLATNTGLDDLLKQLSAEIEHGDRQIPANFAGFNPKAIQEEYKTLPKSVALDASGSVKILREATIKLYNNHLTTLRQAYNLYNNAMTEKIVKSNEIVDRAKKQENLEESLLRAQRELAEYEKKVELITNEINRSNINFVEARMLNSKMETQLSEKVQDYEQRMTQVESLRLELSQLSSLFKQKRQLAEVTANDVKNYHAKVGGMQRKLSELRTQIDYFRTRKEVPQLQSKLVGLQDQKNELKGQQCQVQNQVDELKFKIQSRQTQFDKLFEQQGGQEQQDQMRLLESQVKSLQAGHKELAARVEKYQHIADSFETDIPAKESALDLAKYDLQELSEECTRFEAKVDEKKKKIAHDERSILDLQSQCAQMQSRQQEDEFKLNNAMDEWVKANKRDQDRFEFELTQVEPHYQQLHTKLNFEEEESISNLQQQIDAFEHTLEIKQDEYKGLQQKFQTVSGEINSLQIQLDRYIELYQLSGPQLEMRIVELMNQQARKRQKITRLRDQVAVYDDENLMLRRKKLRDVRSQNSALEQEIVKLGGSHLLQRMNMQCPAETPHYDQMTVDDVRLEGYFDPDLESDDDDGLTSHTRYSINHRSALHGNTIAVGGGGGGKKRSLSRGTVGSTDSVSSHLNDTIYEENGEEISATCDDDGVVDDVEAPGGGRMRLNNDSSETQSLIIHSRNAPQISTIPANSRAKVNVGIAGKLTHNQPIQNASSRFSTNSTLQMRSPAIPTSTSTTGTRPLSKINTSVSNTSKSSTTLPPSKLPIASAPTMSKIPSPPIVPKLNTNAPTTRPSAMSSTSATAKSSIQDPKLPSYMRSTQASRRQ